MTEQTSQTGSQRGQLTTVIAALVLLVCLVGAAVALTFAGMDPAAIVGLLTGIAGIGATLVGLLGKLSSLHQETTQQTASIAKIDHQTNGVLDDRIHKAVSVAIQQQVPHAVTQALHAPIPYVPTQKPKGHK